MADGSVRTTATATTSHSSSSAGGSINEQLSKKTSIFGLHLGVVVGICVGAAFVLLLFLFSICCLSCRNRKNRRRRAAHKAKPSSGSARQTLALASKPTFAFEGDSSSKEVPPEIHRPLADSNIASDSPPPEIDKTPAGLGKIHVDIGNNKEHRITVLPDRVGASSNSHGSGESRSAEQASPVPGPEVSHLGWGHWYTLRELEVATNGFDDENVIGEGGYGIVYHGVLEDRAQIAVKNLLNNRGQAEREFRVEVEAIGRVRHKNLVRLLGYCAEGNHRILVYEYVDNGNLEQWLHGDVGPSSPLTWDIRMNIILGTAKGLMYLHEGLEPKVVHRDVKASNILLDKEWNPKVSDFGLAKLLGSERSYVTTRVMGTFGYVAPEYASTGMLNERSDVYSFGILIMEIISGRSPVNYSRPPGEVNLVEWLKVMVSNRKSEGVLDPKLPEHPNSRALKRVLLVALRCVDPDSTKRPKMGHVIHMLEVDDFPYRDERRTGVVRGRIQMDSSAGDNRKQPGTPEVSDADDYNDPMRSPYAGRVPRWRKQEE